MQTQPKDDAAETRPKKALWIDLTPRQPYAVTLPNHGLANAPSSNGKTPDSDSVYRGSNPRGASKPQRAQSQRIYEQTASKPPPASKPPIAPTPEARYFCKRGAVAQMGERSNRTAEVRGSIPLCSTSTLKT